MLRVDPEEASPCLLQATPPPQHPSPNLVIPACGGMLNQELLSREGITSVMSSDCAHQVSSARLVRDSLP